ncbi:acetolactate synthase large subunit [Pelagibacterium halotolerans]|uniref:Thiamine pyrophosphate-requiring enzyme n=1 Tax=Pelagibacterium halotolerans (strain DSM 22347 / JCM 15775 / CGMCC 1.7692 / B2) TaxID=1082931 RepID=G4RBG7_PELHB|nr:acetolactate synthase large subunit [Pelagibacterium halotolerans]AEQ52643.1 thiamine pyrophosphate-requiring enzyme [Pelagibacterium halotolerans B2]SEA83706.1 acetolactate synthase-1/2/3 large subunit [Pelagibacterium halotolerans]
MNGAEALIQSLIANGVTTCFANPGTSEMHFVAATNAYPSLRNVLCLFEGVATGAADGYGRMSDAPAATLLHLGFGLSNGLANLHNARRSGAPVLNIVGEHASWYQGANSALSSDIQAIAAPMSDWVHVSQSAEKVASDAARAIAAAHARGGQVATLILPADTAWTDGAAVPSQRSVPLGTTGIDPDTIERAARMLAGAGRSIIIAAGQALRAGPMDQLARIAAKTGAKLATPYGVGRLERGAGRVSMPRLPALIDPARALFEGIDTIILAGTNMPSAMFAYPGKPRQMQDDTAQVLGLCEDFGATAEAIECLADAVGAGRGEVIREALREIEGPSGALTADTMLVSVAAAMPENAIIVDESISAGRNFFPLSQGAVPHDYLQLTGGALGCGIPVSLGAAIACPDRRVINMEGDGSAMYTLQGLWSQARENADVTTVIVSNRRYGILDAELKSVGVQGEVRGSARRLLSLDAPAIDWIGLAKGMGVEAKAVTTGEDLVAAITHANGRTGPFLIEAIIG